ncbi:hypothetical protein IPA_01285 [Ignicoccus pacificus DSM 13166]|uniref:Uncharacterized protein n=1 Tax=Ignicoccus pacificus DSM 13166 TaxID=940294 RepID=A0A977PJT2_9CREN|nr:hypothetical protein IPA_01285 [Ignicoccus pacificus DSM 13166]
MRGVEIAKEYVILIISITMLLLVVGALLPKLLLPSILLAMIVMRKMRKKYIVVDERDEFVIMKSCRPTLLLATFFLVLLSVYPELSKYSQLFLVAVFGLYYLSMVYYYKRFG